MHIHLPEAAFHTKEIDLVFLVSQVINSGGEPIALECVQLFGRFHRINGVRPDELPVRTASAPSDLQTCP